MIELTEEMLRGLQQTELELLQEIDRVCKKHAIPYCIIAGTMLGAARHGGFIPWDDDADVAMLRKDYERFKAACAEELDGGRFYFQDHENTPGYRWGYGKLRRKDTMFLREHQEHMPYEQGVFVDVFPLDNVPDSKIGRTIWNFRCFCVRKVLWAPVGAIADTHALARGLYGLLARIPERRVKRRLNALIRRAGSGSQACSRWVRILMYPTPTKDYGYLREWYASQAPIEFEGITFPGVSDADAYLSFKFGTWRQLPPQSQRKVHPVSAFKLPGMTEVRE